MPKPIVMIVAVEELLAGKIWRLLDSTPGVVEINIQGSGPKPNGAAVPSKANGKNNGTPARILVLNALLSKSPQSKEALGNLLEKNGKMRSTLPSTIAVLKQKKHIAAVDDGFKITSAGTKAATTEQDHG
jgi:hypothetical protein